MYLFCRGGANNDVSYTCYKRGVSTGCTRGNLNSMGLDKSLIVGWESDSAFSQARDSGSLVFAAAVGPDEDSTVIYPVGIHYSSNKINCSFVTPLWNVLYDFTIKNQLESLYFSIVNPEIEGVIEFIPKQFPDELWQSFEEQLQRPSLTSSSSCP
jgi:hypothetical protein